MKFASNSYTFPIVITPNYHGFCIWFQQNSQQLFSTVLQCLKITWSASYFTTLFIHRISNLKNWYVFPMCIYIPLNSVGYFCISKYNLKLCWTCFSECYSNILEKFISVTSIHTKHSYTFPMHQYHSQYYSNTLEKFIYTP